MIRKRPELFGLLLLVAVLLISIWEPVKNGKVQQSVPEETETVSATLPADETQQALAILETMTRQEKLYQLFMVAPEQLVSEGETDRQAISSKPVGGIVYFSNDIQTPEQTKMMIQRIQSASKLGLFIGVDEEGGSVVRIADNPQMGVQWFPAMAQVGAENDPQQAYNVGFTIGSQIKELGFNLDFAPVADVFSNPNNKVIGDRAFGSDPQAVATLVEACTRGFSDSGVLCSLKHFPGHGDTGTDSHYGVAQSAKTLEQLRACEFLPFQAGIQAGTPLVMVGHVTMPNVTEEDLPATLSKEIVETLLRQELGYQGLVITDAMNMGAVADYYDAGEAAVLALNAGVDVILMPEDLETAVAGVEQALDAGTLTQAQIDEKVLRILETKIKAGIISVQYANNKNAKIADFLENPLVIRRNLQ